ncbi:MAG: ribonucleotide-diphosphate reductase subunit alpha [Candidatus Zixiibacteriota bacterium]|nr:MAG: ribonucleotide-diphosphate reductase subunit alpha [candidate division Zixibacteria bacterium]
MWSRDDIPLSDNATTILERRYLSKDKQGRVIETPRELFIRVAKHVAKADRNYGADDTQVDETASRFFEAMTSLEFLPNSPTLMNAGRLMGQLSACFVLPVGDSLEEIFETSKHAALIHQSGGGTGFSFSRLRPRNSPVASTSGVASGPVSFMKVYDAATDAIKQGGTRRGANMGVLLVDHPDILEFIACKNDPGEINNFNLSVAITDDFMSAVETGKSYPLLNPHTGKTHIVDGKEVLLDAREVFDFIVEHAWATGEPGIIFLDRMNQHNSTYPHEVIEATNPCGEQPLPPYDSCNLGSINLGLFVKEPLPDNYARVSAADGVDWTRLGEVVRLGVHFLDNVIDQNRYPLPQIEEQSQKNRRIGLGIMGWADMLIKLRLPYDSPDALTLADRVMEFVDSEAKSHSSELAKSRGRFPNWENSVYAREGVAMRNAAVTTIAPTGTISIIAGCSSGIEPYYSLVYERNVLDGTRLREVNPLFEKAVRESGCYSDELVQRIASRCSIAQVQEIPESIRALFVTAEDVSAEDHVKAQAAFQKHCDASVSKTINLPQSATREDVKAAYSLAYELGCKGVTVYRDNSRPNQVLSAATSSRSIDGKTTVAETRRSAAKRPLLLSGFTEKILTGYGNLYVTVNTLDGRPFEVFAQIGKSGYTTMADSEAICRLISLALRSGLPVGAVTRQLRGIGGSSQVFSGGGKVTSIPDAIAQVLERHFGGDKPDSADTEPGTESRDICPSCGGAMRFESGCYCCISCGYSTC